MGFLDNLREIGDGIRDVVSAPIGLIWDTARAITSDKYNPGFGRFSEGVEQFIGGASQIGTGLNLDDAGRWLGETGAGDGIRAFMQEAELLYNHQYQQETGKAPWGLRQLGIDPGQVSVGRVLGTATGAIGSLAQPLWGEGAPDIPGVWDAWRNSANSTPGQALIQGLTDYHNRPREEQQAIESTVWYNMISGTVDAVARWYTDPTVILGKAWKVGRRQMYTFDPVKRMKIATRDIKRRYGLSVGGDTSQVAGVHFANLEGKSTVYVVHRNSTLGAMMREGSVKIAKGADPDMDEVIDALGPDIGTLLLNGEKMDSTLLQGRATRRTPGQKYVGSGYRPVYLESDKNAAIRYASELHKKDPTDMPVILEVETDGLPIALEGIKDPTGATNSGFFTLASLIPEGNIRRVVRHGGDELDPAMRVGQGSKEWEGTQRQLDENLYGPDGVPWEPDDIIRYEEFADDLNTTLSLAMQDSSVAEKFMNHRLLERQSALLPEGANQYDAAMTSRVVQKILNKMDGMDPLSIRLEYFPDSPMGPMLAHLLAEAPDYATRRTILMAGMGYEMPEFATLAPLAKGRLANILDEFERVKAGAPANERLKAMLGENNRFNDQTPEGISQAVEASVTELRDQIKYGNMLDSLSRAKPIQELRMPVLRRYTGHVRRTEWYQHSSLARPIRVVSEMKARQWINTRDPQADLQIKRQLEEAIPLGVRAEDVNDYWTRFTKAATDQERQHIVAQMETLIVEKAAAKAGMTPAEVEETMRAMRRGKGVSEEYLNSRRYASGDQDLINMVDPDTGVITVQRMPILSTQASPWLSLMNVSDVKKATARFRRLRQMGAPVGHLMETFNHLWKPTVLLRGGWPIRVVADEQLRVLAFTGSMLKHIAAIEAGGVTAPTGFFKKGLSLGQRGAEGFATLTLTRPLVSAATLGANGIAKGARALRRYDEDWWNFLHGEDITFEKFVSSRAGFGGRDEAILHSMQALLGRDEMTVLDHLYTKGTGQWHSVGKGDALYGNSWARILSDQFGADPLGNFVVKELLSWTRSGKVGDRLSDDAYDAVIKSSVNFLKNTPTGREVAERMPWRSNDLDRWVQDVIEMVDGYTGHFDTALMEGILNRKVTQKMLENIDETLRPDEVHGEIVSQGLGASPVQQYMRDMFSTAFDLLGRLPTDTLSRQPFFKHLYANEMVRIRDLMEAQGLEFTEQAIQGASRRAREQAIITTRQYLYDLAETSRLGNIARFIMPFYPAWQEVMKVWGTFAINDPSIIARGYMLWQAPNKAGVIQQDENGEEFIQVRLSEKMADRLGVTGWAKYIATGGARFGKSSFNIALNSPLPSVGPLIQIPINEAVKEKPELEAALRWILPFGVSTQVEDILASPLVKSLRSFLTNKSSDDDYIKAYVDSLTWQDVQYRLGERTTPVSADEAHHFAGQLMMVRLMTRLASPAQPIFDSPLKPYYDAYRQMIEEHGPERADELFLNEYGQEFFAVTQSRTVSETGIPPTVEAEVARRKHEELIKKYPEYGRLIIGDEALGEFSMPAYARQSTRPVDSDDLFAEPERVFREVEIDPETGRIQDIDRRIGWQEYIKAMDQLDLYRRQMGLPNLRVAEAEPLQAAKEFATNELARQYPAWFRDFNDQNKLKWQQKIDAFREIVKDPALDNRPDIIGLETYLEARDYVLQELNRRKQLGGASTLEAVANQDLAIAWETAVTQIIEDNIAFQPLYYRYLEGDPVGPRLGPEPSG